MKLSLALGPKGTLDRDKAWICVTANLALPGFGSIAAGRKAGYPQAILGLTGLVLSMAFAGNFFWWYFTKGIHLEADPLDPLAGFQAVWQAAKWPLVGFAIFGLAWCWAGVTSISIFNAARSAPLNPPSPPPVPD